MPENQTAWNSDNQGIKETVNQTKQIGKMGRQREPEAKWWTMWAGLTERETETGVYSGGCHGGRNSQSRVQEITGKWG